MQNLWSDGDAMVDVGPGGAEGHAAPDVADLALRDRPHTLSLVAP